MQPIKPDFISKFWGPNGKGTLGMAFAPGRNKLTAPGPRRSVSQDIATLKSEYNTHTILSLLEDQEYINMGIQEQEQQCRRHNITFLRYPIKDRGIPICELTFKDMIKLIVDQQIKNKQNTVIVHCAAGLGRTGLFAASCLKYIGHPWEDAARLVREIRPGTIEMQIQLDLLKSIEFNKRII